MVIKNVSEGERIASVVGGGALLIYGIGRRSWGGLALAALGGELLRRGATGYSVAYQALGIHTAQREPQTAVPYELGVRVDAVITVNRPAVELYRFWRQVDNLPRFMRHLESVTALDDRRSRWVAQGPVGTSVSWDAEIHHEEENKLIGWRSLPGSQVETAGSVSFKELPNNRGTEVRVTLQYNPPGGTLGAAFAKIFREDPETQIKKDLRAFKQLMETGEIPATEGQSRGASEGSIRERRWPERRDAVQESSEESFPASDAPSWTPERIG